MLLEGCSFHSFGARFSWGASISYVHLAPTVDLGGAFIKLESTNYSPGIETSIDVFPASRWK
jgi:hypothetical protein